MTKRKLDNVQYQKSGMFTRLEALTVVLVCWVIFGLAVALWKCAAYWL